MRRKVITVDGLAGSGKTALSKLLAQKVHFIHVSSGLLYRGAALLAIQAKISAEDGVALKKLISSHSFELKQLKGLDTSALYIDGRNVGDQLHSPEVSEMTSLISRHAEVRAALMPLQRDAFPGDNLVVEGRDIGTVVFPDADLKFFIIADQGVRIKRRIEQLWGDISKLDAEGLKELEDKIRIEVVERDNRDTQRQLSPTKPASDAYIIDNTRGSLTEVLKRMYNALLERSLIKE